MSSRSSVAVCVGVVVFLAGAPVQSREPGSSCSDRQPACRDSDHDGYGDPGVCFRTCDDTLPPGYVDNGLDCNDYDAAVHPGAQELGADGVDNNCNGLVDGADPGALWHMDFGAQGAPPEEGYVRDAGAAFDAAKGVGWLIPAGARVDSRTRNCPGVSTKQQSFVFTSIEQRWEVALLNGDYDVTVSVGDCLYQQTGQRVVVEDEAAIPLQTTAAGQFVTRTQRVSVRDGRLTIAIGGGSRATTLNFVDIAPAAVQPSLLKSINFQPSGAPTPIGFVADDGAVFGTTPGRGWSRDIRSWTRARGRNADAALDSFAFAGASTATYDMELPSGLYDVTVSIGDAMFAQGPQRVLVEGLTAFDGESTGVNQFLKKTVRTLVEDGRLTVTIGGRPEGTFTVLNFLTIAAPAEQRKINFQPAASEAPAGYQPDSGAVYSAERGYGWLASQGGNTRERNLQADQRLDTLLFVGQSAQTWEAALPFGDYLVTVAVGDAGYAQGPHRVIVEGLTVFATETTAKGQFLVRSVRTPVRDGKLTIEVGGATGFTTIDYLDVSEVPHLRAINFQPAAAPVPAGDEPDSGQLYSSARGFGWADNSLYAGGYTRDRNLLSDQELDTFIYYGSPAKTWALDVPNGDYQVALSVGDAGYPQGPHRVLAEGVAFFDGETTAKGQFRRRSACVTVGDGRLSVSLGGTTGITTLNYLKLASSNCTHSFGLTEEVIESSEPERVGLPEDLRPLP